MKHYHNLLNTIFPQKCLICKNEIFLNDGNYAICKSCMTKLNPEKFFRCKKCSKLLISEHEICMRCRNENYLFNINYSLFNYKDEIRNLLHEYKFNKRINLSKIFAEFFYSYLKNIKIPFYIIPVPSKSKIFNNLKIKHMKLITDILKHVYDYNVLDILKKTTSIEQKNVNYENRKKNISGNITVKKESNLKIDEAILLDDIFTTGATVNECTRVLLNNGVKNVNVLTLAID